MDGKNTVHAPYNFISFAESPWLPYQSMDDLPPHDRIDPQRRTGELHITLTAETPVFVAGEKGRSPGDASRFFRTPDGALAIPGSTIRGLTRENMQILSFAPVRVGEDIAENEDSGRKGYKFPIADGLPPKYKELVDAGPLDCPSAILGFSRGRLAYRSRVSFGDFAAEAGAREGAVVRMILGEPKPGYARAYLDRNSRLRGFKQYWLKDTQKTDVPPGKEKVGTALCPLPAGTRFHGVVRFKNLSDAELGLLVWSLCLDEGCYQNVGMGKPYGYGRMSVRVERMVEFCAGRPLRRIALSRAQPENGRGAAKSRAGLHQRLRTGGNGGPGRREKAPAARDVRHPRLPLHEERRSGRRGVRLHGPARIQEHPRAPALGGRDPARPKRAGPEQATAGHRRGKGRTASAKVRQTTTATEETLMAKKIILYLSAYNPNNTSPAAYECPVGGPVEGVQTNDAPVKYLLREHPDISEILCLVTTEAEKKAWGVFRKLWGRRTPRCNATPSSFPMARTSRRTYCRKSFPKRRRMTKYSWKRRAASATPSCTCCSSAAP